MRQKLLALLAVLALAVSLCAVTALAEAQADPREPAGTESGRDSAPEDGAEENAGEETEAPGEAEAPEEEAAPSPAGPDLAENVLLEPDELGSVSFANMERRLRENNLQVLILQQSIDSLEDIDYDKLYDKLWHQLNELAMAQWNFVRGSRMLKSLSEISPDYRYSDYEYTSTYNQLDQAYAAVREQFDAIKDGDMQKDNADLVRQLSNLQDQIVMAGESLYTALVSMEIQKSGLDRQLTALDRTVQEMDLRYNLGQISALQLAQAKAGRASLSSGTDTLAMNIGTYKCQLEALIGAEQTGAITLGAVPAVTAEQLEAMDLEADLETAKSISYELYDAKLTLEDARDDYKDAGDNWGYNENRMEFRNAKRTWNAAQYTYNDTVQNYELKFRTLYAQVWDCKQILDSAKVSLESQKASYQSAELKYRQGTISQNALLDAKDELAGAEEKVLSASNDLFSTYNTYCWAVQHGILN